MLYSINSLENKNNNPVFNRHFRTNVKPATDAIATIEHRLYRKADTLKSTCFEIINRLKENKVLATKLANGINNIRIENSVINVTCDDNKLIKLSIWEVGIHKLFRIKLFDNKELKDMITLDSYKIVERVNKNDISYCKKSNVDTEKIASIIESLYDSLDEPFLELRKYIRNFDIKNGNIPKEKNIKFKPTLEKKEVAPGVTADMLPLSISGDRGEKPLFSYSALIGNTQERSKDKLEKKPVKDIGNEKKKRGRPAKVLPRASLAVSAPDIKQKFLISPDIVARLAKLTSEMKDFKQNLSHVTLENKKKASGLFNINSLRGLNFMTPDTNINFSQVQNKYGEFWKIVDYDADKNIRKAFFIDESGKIVKNWNIKSFKNIVTSPPIYYDEQDVNTKKISSEIASYIDILEEYTEKFKDFLSQTKNKPRTKIDNSKAGEIPPQLAEKMLQIGNLYQEINEHWKNFSHSKLDRLKNFFNINTIKRHGLRFNEPNGDEISILKLNRENFNESNLLKIQLKSSDKSRNIFEIFDGTNKIVKNVAGKNSNNFYSKLRYKPQDEINTIISKYGFQETIDKIIERLIELKKSLFNESWKIKSKPDYKIDNTVLEHLETLWEKLKSTENLGTSRKIIKKDFDLLKTARGFAGFNFIRDGKAILFDKNQNRFGTQYRIVLMDNGTIQEAYVISNDGKIAKNIKDGHVPHAGNIIFAKEDDISNDIVDKINSYINVLENFSVEYENQTLQKISNTTTRKRKALKIEKKTEALQYDDVKAVMENAINELENAINEIKKDFGVINKFNLAVNKAKKDFKNFLSKIKDEKSSKLKRNNK